MARTGEGIEVLAPAGNSHAAPLVPAPDTNKSHTLKGAGANVGASGLAEVCAALAQCARRQQLHDAAHQLEQFEAELARVLAALHVAAEGKLTCGS